MQIALPRFKDEFDLPANRIGLDYCCSLPNHGRDIADKEVPGQQVQMGSGGRVAFFLRLLLRDSPPFVDHGFWHPHRHQTRWHQCFCPNEDVALDEMALDSVEHLCQLHGLHPTGTLDKEFGLMIESR